MGQLFHYTTNEGAIGLINSACLFATNYKYLNDQHELAIARNILIPLFERELEVEARRLVTQQQLHESYLTDFGQNIFRMEATRIFDVILRVTDSNTPIFIASFCRHKENSEEWEHGLLSQWRGYASTGGCAIELEEQTIQDLIEPEARRYAHTHVSLKNVVYEDHEKAIDIKQIDGLAAAMLRMIAQKSGANEAEYKRRIDAMYDTIALVAPTLKTKGFIEEQEARIIAPHMRPEAAKQFPTRIQRPINFRFKNGIPIPYIKLFDGIARLPIKRIIVGPQRNQEKISYVIELALEAKGINAKVTKSNIGYMPD